MKKSFFRYTPWDALPALGGVGIVALVVWTYRAFPTMSWPVLILSFLAVALCYCWNLQCISHNFIHNPFFTSTWLNRIFSVVNSLAIGVPQILYHHYHMNHHFGNNDTKGGDGTTRDWSSTFRYGMDDHVENFWRYILLGFFRAEVGPVVKKVAVHGPVQVAQLVAESLVLVGFWSIMLIGDWRYFLCFYLPSYYLGWVLSYAEGYLEHYQCQPHNRLANSVSSYNWLYNLLWFNNGYHQEHHWSPKVHWRHMPELHNEIKPELQANGTRVLRGPHLTALIEEWLEQKWAKADKTKKWLRIFSGR